MRYPEHSAYERLYARYLRPERMNELLDKAGCLQGLVLYDLCGGGGRLSLAALERGARVTLVDESVEMALSARERSPGVRVILRSVREALTLLEPADVVVCQQAVNYWLSAEMAKKVAMAVKPGGRFVFNTFNRKPSRTPQIKPYLLDGRQYVEMSWLRTDEQGTEVVEHVQVCEGMAPHTTTFAWISREQYLQWLSPYFDCTEDVDSATSVWTCVRKAL